MRFVEGEMARVVVCTNPRYQNEVVEVIGVGPYKQFDMVKLPGRLLLVSNDCDYIVQAGEYGKLAFDYQLAKIEPPAEQETITKAEETEA